MFKYRYHVYGLILAAGIVLAWLLYPCGNVPVTRESRQLELPSTPPPVVTTSPGGIAFGSLTAQVPSGWRTEQPSTSMRIEQFRLSGVDMGEEDAELAVFSGIGGSAEDNLARWFNQFEQPDGSLSGETAGVRTFSIDGMNVTMADLSGTFLGSGMMGSDPVDRPGYRLLAAIVEAADDTYYFKLVGPEPTVRKWARSFDEFIRSIKRTGS